MVYLVNVTMVFEDIRHDSGDNSLFLHQAQRYADAWNHSQITGVTEIHC